MRQALIDQYCEGPGVVTAALAGATDEELDARPAPNEWSAREVVHHLADSEATSYIRIRKLLAEDDPVIYGYDEAEFARRLHYDRPIAASLAVLKSVRASTTELLRSLDEDDWAAQRHPHRERSVLRPDVARDLRRPRARPRGPDQPSALCRHSLVNHRVISDRVIRRR